MSETTLTRGTFVKGGIASGVALAGLGLAGQAQAEEAAAADTETLPEPSETVETQIVIVGSGPAGLSAALEASEAGADVVLMDAKSDLGGNIDITGGLFGVDSKFTKEMGIEVDPMDIVNEELKVFTYRVDALKWRDLVEASGDDVDWLSDHGVEYMEVIDYSNTGTFPICHNWGPTFAPTHVLVSALEKTGCTIMTETRGRKLVVEDGKVTGILAERADGSVVQVNAPAVIIATGGYVDNTEMVKKVLRSESYFTRAMGGHNGDGINMAVEAGALSMLPEKTLMAYPVMSIEENMGWYNTLGMILSGSVVWVSSDGRRFTNEACTEITEGLAIATCLTQRQSYTLVDQGIMDSYGEHGFTKEEQENIEAIIEGTDVEGLNDGLKYILDCAVDAGEQTIWRGDSWEELAEAAGMDPDTLVETVERYNADCAAGKDSEYAKNPEKMIALDTPPFYLVKNGYYVTTTLGGLDYDRDMRVLDEMGVAIPGLYVAGTDGAQIYKGFYTIDTVSGSCMANNVYTGRKAARSAMADIEKA